MHIRRKTLNNINEVDNTDFQTGNKMYRKLLFAEGSLGSFLWSVLDENLWTDRGNKKKNRRTSNVIVYF